METKPTAVLLGATGLVGSQLLKLLLLDEHFGTVRTFGRRPSGSSHPKLKEFIVDFEKPAEWEGAVTGDVLFSAFGTTRAQAGGKEPQYKIDVTYQLEMARIAKKNDIPHYVLVSTPGANPKSPFFYTRIRGVLDEQVKQLGFGKVSLIKPSILVGKRERKRTGESIGISMGNVIFRLPGLRKYRPIPAETVAKAMISAYLNQQSPFEEYTLERVFIAAEG